MRRLDSGIPLMEEEKKRAMEADRKAQEKADREMAEAKRKAISGIPKIWFHLCRYQLEM